MHFNSKDITGNRYGKLVVLEPTNERYSNGSIKWKCRCDCGNIYYTSSSELKRGRKSCGCETKLIDLTGKKFGKLLVLKRSYDRKRKTYWTCQCECGNQKDVCGSHLTSGKIVSCGCSSVERISNLNKTHGMSQTRLYNIWVGMKERCYNPNTYNYYLYGEREITICKEWRDDFMSFYEWSMKNGYKDDLTIDRIDVNGNYEPDNCRWATRKEQACNTRRTKLFEHNGQIKTLLQISLDEGISYNKLLNKVSDRNVNIVEVIKEIKETKRKKE